ncbi:GntR family transcriptional regulator [Cognatishimia sp.]|uniref:GntR family transcriptional regulator n=1 Tax=Cognatishimia sp. TaxID=2211648 RepID=UPI0035134D5E
MRETEKSPKQSLADHLKSAILTTSLAPGSDLDEAQLAQQFGLSRTPLREVLRELAGDGYLTLHPNRGTRVSDMTFATMRGFFQAAPMIYGAILRMAALHATPAQIEELKAAQDIFKATLTSGTAADRALSNNRFHEITGVMAANIYLQPSFNRLLIDHARLSMTFYDPNAVQLSAQRALASQQHDAIIAAIEARDADGAAQLAIDHWNLSRDQIEMFVFPEALDMPLGNVPQHMPA